MPRHLHANGVPEFLDHYEVGDRCGNCGSDNLGVTVWDHYGTMPDDGSPEAKTGVGAFLAALVICQDCEQVIALDRARLAGTRAAE